MIPVKIIFAVLCFMLIYLHGSIGSAADDISGEGAEQDVHQPVYSSQSFEGNSGNERFCSSEDNREAFLLSEKRSITEPRIKILLERSDTDETKEEKESFMGESDLKENISIPLVLNEAVEHYIRYFTTKKKDLFKRWLRRKKRYAPLVKEILREHGLPEDLVYLAMIESGFNLHACSPMKAAGPWQFIPETGRRYGLVVNHWVDERRDLRKSTVAAARYLQELFDQFGCWYLAAAGYNAGENRIDRLIKRYDTKDFWKLRAYNTLPRETREYVPQLIAAAVIAKDPERYGLGAIENLEPFEFIRVTVPGGVPLKAVAKAASIDLPSVRILNPEIRRGITPPGKVYGIKLPADTDTVTFRSSLTSILDEGRRVVGVFRHMTRRRDNVRKITRRYGVSTEDLILVNGKPLKLNKGKAVYIPRFDDGESEGKGTRVKTANLRKRITERTDRSSVTDRKNIIHVVKKGETLSSIAAQYGVDVRMLKRVNQLKTDRIEWGKRLSLAGHERKVSQQEQKKYYRVQNGDTLSGIAEKYGKSVRTLRNMNRLKNNRIQKGMRLRIALSGISSDMNLPTLI
jgi:membrane-bound lytic murein transglycosylase D